MSTEKCPVCKKRPLIVIAPCDDERWVATCPNGACSFTKHASAGSYPAVLHEWNRLVSEEEAKVIPETIR